MVQDKIQIIQVTPQQLKDLISESIKVQFSELKEGLDRQQNSEKLFSRKETADLLGVNLSTLWSWTKKRKISSCGIGNRVYYKYQDIQAALVELNSNAL